MSSSAPIISSTEEKGFPDFELSQWIHRYNQLLHKGDEASLRTCQNSIIRTLEENSMSSLYESLSAKYSWDIDNALLDSMRSKNDKVMEDLNAKYEDALKNAGDLEILDITSSRGKQYSRIGDWKLAMAEFDFIVKKEKATTGRKIDAQFEMAKVALFNSDIDQFKSILVEAAKLVEKGGDWDRRNKLRFFESIQFILTRDFAKASVNLMDAIATFSCTEVCSYEVFMFYALITNLLTLSRNTLKAKIIDNAHVISVLIEAPKLRNLVENFYNCDYKAFMKGLVSLEADLLSDRYFAAHTVYILREFRVLAFKQFLEAYKSVMLSSMAAAFGISTAMLDRELSHFIATGRLSAKIDKVGDIVETIKSDKKNAQYQEIVKKGDALLNHIQKLVRVIDQ